MQDLGDLISSQSAVILSTELFTTHKISRFVFFAAFLLDILPEVTLLHPRHYEARMII